VTTLGYRMPMKTIKLRRARDVQLTYLVMSSHRLYRFVSLAGCIFFSIRYTGWRKKRRSEHLHALFSRMIEMNQLKSIYVMSKHQRICVEIFA